LKHSYLYTRYVLCAVGFGPCHSFGCVQGRGAMASAKSVGQYGGQSF